jgi:hypothetical protein
MNHSDVSRPSRIHSLAVVGLVTIAVLVLASNVQGAGVGVQLGPIVPESIAIRGYAVWNTGARLAVESGALVVRQGAILDVTPMFHSSGRLFAAAGIGVAYNAIQNQRQSKGAIFHDVIGGGYNISKAFAVTCHVQHWSNGGRYNPLFGTHFNRGYTALMFGMTQRL